MLYPRTDSTYCSAEVQTHFPRPSLECSPQERGLVSAARCSPPRSCGSSAPGGGVAGLCSGRTEETSPEQKQGLTGALAHSCWSRRLLPAQAQLRTPMQLPAGGGPARGAVGGPAAACLRFSILAPQREQPSLLALKG